MILDEFVIFNIPSLVVDFKIKVFSPDFIEYINRFSLLAIVPCLCKELFNYDCAFLANMFFAVFALWEPSFLEE
jgi:hypothetical protein